MSLEQIFIKKELYRGKNMEKYNHNLKLTLYYYPISHQCSHFPVSSIPFANKTKTKLSIINYGKFSNTHYKRKIQ